MSDLREKIAKEMYVVGEMAGNAKRENAEQEWDNEDTLLGIEDYYRDADIAIQAFKAHIEKYKPENPYNKTDSLSYGQFLHKGFLKGIEEYYKALMESLE